LVDRLAPTLKKIAKRSELEEALAYAVGAFFMPGGY